MITNINIFLTNTPISFRVCNTLARSIRQAQKPQDEGKLENWKLKMFNEIAEMRDMEEHTGGRRKNAL